MTFGQKLAPHQRPDYLRQAEGIKTEGATEREINKQQAQVGAARDKASEAAIGKIEGEKAATFADRRRKAQSTINARSRSDAALGAALGDAIALISQDKGVGQGARFSPEWVKSNTNKLKNYLKTIKSSIGVEKLLEVKRQGGTFGALSENELDLLLSLEGPLDQMYPDQLLDTLRNIQANRQAVMNEMKANFFDEFGGEIQDHGSGQRRTNDDIVNQYKD